jgi:lysozyme
MLTGIDISRYQKNLDKQYIIKQDFVMIKATEGTTYKDFMMDGFTNLVNKHGILKGYYHKARPEKNPSVKEADKFISKVKHHLGNSLLALECGSDINEMWALDWLNNIKDKTGVTPLFQISGKYVDKYKLIQEAGYPLWIVDWTIKTPNIGNWNNWLMWQNTVDMNNIVNQNKFNGTVDDFKEHCRRR